MLLTAGHPQLPSPYVLSELEPLRQINPYLYTLAFVLVFLAYVGIGAIALVLLHELLKTIMPAVTAILSGPVHFLHSELASELEVKRWDAGLCLGLLGGVGVGALAVVIVLAVCMLGELSAGLIMGAVWIFLSILILFLLALIVSPLMSMKFSIALDIKKAREKGIWNL